MRGSKFILFFLMSVAAFASKDIKLDKSIIKSEAEHRNIKFIPAENKNTYVVDQEQIQDKNYKNVEEVLNDVPGVVVQNTPFGPKVDMRGSGEKALSRVKVLVDGISINPTEGSMASLPINSIPVESIKKIEVIPGGGVTLYGSGTIGGVVNIETNSNAAKNNFFTDVKYGSYDNRIIGFSGGNNLTDKLYMNYGFNYTNSDTYREDESKDNKTFLGGFDYKINDKSKIVFQMRNGKNKNNGSTEVTKEILEKNRQASGVNMDLDTTDESYVLDYKLKATDKLAFSASIYEQKQKRDVDAESIDTIEVISYPEGRDDAKSYYIFRDTKSIMKAKMSEEKQGIKLKGKYDYDNGEILFGYDYFKGKTKRDSDVTSESLKTYYNGNWNVKMHDPGAFKTLVSVDIEKESHSVYAFNKYDLTDKLEFTTGARGEFTKYSGERVNGPNFNPISPVQPKVKNIKTDRSLENYAGELGILYKENEKRSYYARYERGFVTPYASQLTDKVHNPKGKDRGPFMLPIVMNTVSLYVDNNLKPETTDTIDIGIRNYIGNSFVGLSLFVTDTQDEITLISSGVTNPAIKRWKYRNLDKTRRMGIELQSEQVFDKFSLNQSLTLLNAKSLSDNEEANIQKGDDIPLVSKAKLTLGGKYNFTDNFSVLGTYTYLSSREARELDKNDNAFTHKIDGYGVLDVGLMYKFDEYSSVRAGVKNLAGTKYNLRETSKEAYPAPERNYYLEFAVKF